MTAKKRGKPKSTAIRTRGEREAEKARKRELNRHDDLVERHLRAAENHCTVAEDLAKNYNRFAEAASRLSAAAQAMGLAAAESTKSMGKYAEKAQEHADA